jgi:hypothetical protein
MTRKFLGNLNDKINLSMSSYNDAFLQVQFAKPYSKINAKEKRCKSKAQAG